MLTLNAVVEKVQKECMNDKFWIGNPNLLDYVDWTLATSSSYKSYKLVKKQASQSGERPYAPISLVGKVDSNGFYFVPGGYRSVSHPNATANTSRPFEKERGSFRLGSTGVPELADMWEATVQGVRKLENPGPTSGKRGYSLMKGAGDKEQLYFSARHCWFQEIKKETKTPSSASSYDDEQIEAAAAALKADLEESGEQQEAKFYSDDFAVQTWKMLDDMPKDWGKLELKALIEKGEYIGVPPRVYNVDGSAIHPNDIQRKLKGALVKLMVNIEADIFNIDGTTVNFFANVDAIHIIAKPDFESPMSPTLKRKAFEKLNAASSSAGASSSSTHRAKKAKTRAT